MVEIRPSRATGPSGSRWRPYMTTQSTVAITGNTYPVKDQIKALGGRWNAASKAWLVPADKADAARQLVANAKSSNYAPRHHVGAVGSYRTIGQRMESRRASGWTGCSCGSIEGRPRNSDCAQCQHDY